MSKPQTRSDAKTAATQVQISGDEANARQLATDEKQVDNIATKLDTEEGKQPMVNQVERDAKIAEELIAIEKQAPPPLPDDIALKELIEHLFPTKTAEKKAKWISELTDGEYENLGELKKDTEWFQLDLPSRIMGELKKVSGQVPQVGKSGSPIFGDVEEQFKKVCSERNIVEMKKLHVVLKQVENSHQSKFSEKEKELAKSQIRSEAASDGYSLYNSEEGDETIPILTRPSGSTNFPAKPQWSEHSSMSNLSFPYKNSWKDGISSVPFQESETHALPEDVFLAFDCLRILILWMHVNNSAKESLLQTLILSGLTYMVGHSQLAEFKFEFIDARKGDEFMLYLNSDVFGMRCGYTDLFLTKDGYYVALLELKLFLTKTSSLGQCVAGLQALTNAVNEDWDGKLSEAELCRPVGILYNGLGAMRVQTVEGKENAFRMDAASVKGFMPSAQLIWNLVKELGKTDAESMVFSPMKTRLQRKETGSISRFVWSSGLCLSFGNELGGQDEDGDENDAKNRKTKASSQVLKENTSSRTKNTSGDRTLTNKTQHSKQHTLHALQPHELLIKDIENMARISNGAENWLW